MDPKLSDLPSGISYEMIPSLDPAALAMPPDNDWSSSSDWSSRPSTPAQGLPFTEPLQVSTYAYLSQMQLVPSSGPSSQNTYGFSAPGTSDSRPSSPETPKRKDRIPRPPNAFMLYRSHLLKTGRIPREVEQRQQNISRVAGECWNMLTKEEKAVWHAEAKKAMELHKIRHPGWKFSPERRSARRKPFDLDGAPVDGKEHIRRIREQCVGIIGPAVSPPRPRKPRSRRGAEAREQTASLPPSLHPSPSTTPVSHLISSAPPSLTGSPASHVLPITAFNSGPDYMLAMPHPDFFQQEFLARYPVSAPQSHVPLPTTALDDDATPRASTFGHIALPSQLKFDSPPALLSGDDNAARDMGLVAESSSLAASPSKPAEGSRPSTPAGATDWVNLFGCDLQGAMNSISMDLGPVAHDPSLTYALDFDADALFPSSDP